MKKTSIYLIIFLGFFQLAWSQQDVDRANKLFEKTYYTDAIPIYEEALTTSRSEPVVRNLADAYYHTFKLENAARWYRYLIANYASTTSEESYFRFHHALKAVGKYDEAQELLTQYYTAQGHTKKLASVVESKKYVENIKAIGDRFSIANSALNTESSEFGATEIGDTIWYSASRKKMSSKKYRWNKQRYLDIYQHPLAQKTAGDSVSKPIAGMVNTRMHEGTFAITSDGKTLYFTRNNVKNRKRKTDDNKVSNLKIYKATLVNGAWKNITQLPFNSDDFSNEHPSLNADETKLYFASDRPSGFGSFDIYEVHLMENDVYSLPKNLGALVNTDKKEQFPFLDKNNTLYFSSDGHPGFGLLDVFVSTYENGNFQQPDNVGTPVNSGYDDFSYILSTDKTGYFASNRPEGMGSDDIYGFTITKDLIIEDCKQLVSGIITDRTTTLPLSDAVVTLLEADETIVSTIKTGADGAFTFEASCETAYMLITTKSDYQSNKKTISTSNIRNATIDASMDLYATADQEKAAALARQQQKAQELEKANALALKVQEEEKATQIRLAAQTAKAKQVAEAKKIADKLLAEENLAKKIAQAMVAAPNIKKDKDRTIIQTEEIHFDYSLWYLRRESRERLQGVIKIMKENPGMVLEIGTHTDIRGNASYNAELSQKRADSAKEFLVKNGIEPDRVVSKGYGESKPMVVCPTETDCTEEDHEWNRRCEFVVLGWDYKGATP